MANDFVSKTFCAMPGSREQSQRYFADESTILLTSLHQFAAISFPVIKLMSYTEFRLQCGSFQAGYTTNHQTACFCPCSNIFLFKKVYLFLMIDRICFCYCLLSLCLGRSVSSTEISDFTVVVSFLEIGLVINLILTNRFSPRKFVIYIWLE